MKKRLRFRREARMTGLAAIGQGTRAYELMYGDDCMARVCPKDRREKELWYWHTMDAKPYANSATEKKYLPLDEAKKAARSHVESFLRSQVA